MWKSAGMMKFPSEWKVRIQPCSSHHQPVYGFSGLGFYGLSLGQPMMAHDLGVKSFLSVHFMYFPKKYCLL